MLEIDASRWALMFLPRRDGVSFRRPKSNWATPPSLRGEEKPGERADSKQVLADRQISVDGMVPRELGAGQAESDRIKPVQVTTARKGGGAIVEIEGLPTVLPKMVWLLREKLG